MNLAEIDKNFFVEQSFDRTDVKGYNILNAPFSIHGLILPEDENDGFHRIADKEVANLNKNIARLQTHTAGGRVRFSTDSPYIAIRAKFRAVGRSSHLTLVSTSGVFDKYLVEGYKVSDEAYRYYNIVAIYREFNANIDTNLDGADSVEKAIGVGQQWCAYYLNDTLVYEMGTFETLDIVVQYTGSLTFSEGITIGNIFGSFTWGHSWFVAFNVEDYVVEHIYDAKLSYSVRSMTRVSGVGASGEWSYGEFEHKEVWLKDTDTASYNGGGLFAKEYSWNRISSSEDFIANAEAQDVTISEECKSKLEESQWVFAFVETEKDEYYSEGSMVTIQRDIDDVTILTLHFVDINHKIYNLGVVGDRVNPDNESDGYGGMQTPEDAFRQALVEIYTAMIIFFIIILVVVLGFPLLRWIFRQ